MDGLAVELGRLSVAEVAVDDPGICPPAAPVLSVFVPEVVSPVVVAMDREELDSDVEFVAPPALPADGVGVAVVFLPWWLPPTAPPTMAPIAATAKSAKMIIHFVVRHQGVCRCS